MYSDLKSDYHLIPTNDVPLPEKTGGKGLVAVLMSGGVDSSAAALLLQNAGYDIAGLTMRIMESDENAVESAAAVCKTLSVPHFWVDLKNEFHKFVIEPFCTSYMQGETPNPCADCNERVKLGLLSEIAATRWGAEAKIATGHYARILRSNGTTCLCRAQNLKKDQSYFLAGVRYPVLERLLFPLGEMDSKEETRKLVREAGIAVADRPESMEICFANERDYRDLSGHSATPGVILDTEGKKIGEHTGIAHYTLGQRKGLGIASPHPLYVVEIRPRDNVVVAAPRELAFTDVVNAEYANILLPEETRSSALLFGKIRSQGEPAPCRILRIDENRVSVRFERPLFAPAPGQRLVLYTEEGCVALGGRIAKADSERFLDI